jgi:hypothetical protein
VKTLAKCASFAVAALLSSYSSASAQPAARLSPPDRDRSAAVPAEVEALPLTPSVQNRAAIGLSTGFQRRRDYGDDTRIGFVPELLGQYYVPLPIRRLYLRPGVRLGFVGFSQAAMPSNLRVEERDLVFAGEVGILFDAPVVPVLSFGVQGTARFIHTEASGPIRATVDGDRSEFLPGVYSQLGIGIPIARGRVIFEPFLRYQHVFGDDRLGLHFGADLTVAIF